MQPSHYSTCLYGREGWATPTRHAQSLHDYIDIDFRFKQSRSGNGNGYVASCGVQAAATLDVPRRTCRTTDMLGACAQSYDDVISGVYNEAVQSGAVIARRNERERNRVRTINQTFARLRQHLPSSAAASVVKPAAHSGASTVAKAKKLSKVQILRAAIHYIGQLQQLLTTTDDDDTDSPIVISDAGYSRKLNQYVAVSSSSDSSSGSASVTAGAEDDRQKLTDCSSRCTSTDVKRKRCHVSPSFCTTCTVSVTGGSRPPSLPLPYPPLPFSSPSVPPSSSLHLEVGPLNTAI